MGYDSWKLRSDMDEHEMGSNAGRAERIHEIVSRSCAGPCEPCWTDDKTMAVSTQTINGRRCCDHHFACEGCGFTFHTDDTHMNLGAPYCGACYYKLDDVHAGLEEQARDDRRGGK